MFLAISNHKLQISFFIHPIIYIIILNYALNEKWGEDKVGAKEKNLRNIYNLSIGKTQLKS